MAATASSAAVGCSPNTDACRPRAGEVLEHVGSGGASPSEEDVHDLPLAAAEDGVQRVGHRPVCAVLCK
jgi:hypothetical protein